MIFPNQSEKSSEATVPIVDSVSNSNSDTCAVGVADDSKAPGGEYVSVTDEDGMNQSIVYDSKSNVVKDMVGNSCPI
jgi:hypothetical protein